MKQRRFPVRQSGDFDNGALGGKIGHRDRYAFEACLGDHAQALAPASASICRWASGWLIAQAR
jgi:hypothetical protein